MLLTLGQAAKETGKSKSTILMSIRAGRLSATRNEMKQWQIDPAELFRVYPPANESETDENPPNAAAILAQQLEKEIQERERERRQLQAQIEDLKQDRDQWRNQATALLTHQPEPTPAPAAPTSNALFEKLFGKKRP